MNSYILILFSSASVHYSYTVVTSSSLCVFSPMAPSHYCNSNIIIMDRAYYSFDPVIYTVHFKEGIQTLIDLMHWRHKGSHLHNNDASLVSRSAHVLCWQCALALSLSMRGPRRASPAVWQCRGCPPGCMLGDDARGSVSFDPQRSWAPFCDVICIWSITKETFLECILISSGIKKKGLKFYKK